MVVLLAGSPRGLREVKNAAWVRNPIDAFIAAEHEKRGSHRQPEAEASLLCRRLYLDLVGLPLIGRAARIVRPRLFATATCCEAAYAGPFVDRLLASPQYGERWGRHWMDVWRYSDWWGLGEQVIHNSQKHIWHWRDWIVESLNDDVGYDELPRRRRPTNFTPTICGSCGQAAFWPATIFCSTGKPGSTAL